MILAIALALLAMGITLMWAGWTNESPMKYVRTALGRSA